MFHMELFNAFNTLQLGKPGSTLGTGTFGGRDEHRGRSAPNPIRIEIQLSEEAKR
jgi:hypothetical protein